MLPWSGGVGAGAAEEAVRPQHGGRGVRVGTRAEPRQHGLTPNSRTRKELEKGTLLEGY